VVGGAADELAAADRLLGASEAAFRGHRYLAASFLAKGAYDLVRKGARQAGVPVVGSHDGWQVDEPGSDAAAAARSRMRPPSTTSARAATGCATEGRRPAGARSASTMTGLPGRLGREHDATREGASRARRRCRP
jgi:hypothetical protein